MFFDFVAENPEAFILGVRELHGASPVLRAALEELMEAFGADMAEDILELKLLPDSVSRGAVIQVSNLISRTLFQQSLDYLGHAQRRSLIRTLAEEQILMLFAGASVLQSLGQLQLPQGQ